MAKNTLTTPEVDVPAQQQSTIVARSGEASLQNTLRNISLIIGREYKNRVSQRSFKISTAVLMLLIIIGSFVPTIIQFFASGSSLPSKIGLINNAGAVAGLQGASLNHFIETGLNGTTSQAAGTGSGSRFTITSGSSANLPDLLKQVKRGSLPVLLVLNRNGEQQLQFTYYSASDPSSNATDTTLPQVQAIASQLSTMDKSSRLGLTPTQTSSLFTPPSFAVVNTQQVQDHRSVGERVAGSIIAYAGIILIFMSIFMYGMGVAMGVAEEKGTRIMEILVNAATPFQLLAGKILGIGAAGLTQMAALVVVGIASLLLQNPLKTALFGSSSGGFSVDITVVSVTLLALVLVYFIFGFLLYASLFAAMGALVKRQDEVQNAVTPITWLFMVGYFVSFFGIYDSSATWVRIVALIPFWTPTVMLMRVGTGTAAGWEVALSIVLMIAAIFFCTLISARIYRFGILMYGQKPKLRQLAKIARSAKAN